MAKNPYPSDKQDQFMLRLPDGMRDRIKAAADKNGRSMNAEIVALLEKHFPPLPTLQDLMRRSTTISAQLSELLIHGNDDMSDETRRTAYSLMRALSAIEEKIRTGDPHAGG